MNNNGRVLATKSISPLFTNLFFILIGLSLMLFLGDVIDYFIYGAIVFTISAFLLVKYLLAPSKIIILDEENQLHLPNNKVIHLLDITSSNAPMARNNIGLILIPQKLNIYTKNKTFTCRFIKNPEGVKIELERLQRELIKKKTT